MVHYISAAMRRNIHKYKYASVDDSLISKYILTPYWNWLVQLFPLTIAPNTITLSGLVLVATNVLALLCLDATLDNSTGVRLTYIDKHYTTGLLPVVSLLPNAGFPKEVALVTKRASESVIPPWMLFVWSLCLFLYQSLDSIDGKQARRTGMAGPLGELFDHGCDALNTTLENVLVMSAMGLGRSYWAVLGLLSSLANFYLTTWEELHTHTLYLSAFSGPVEGILMVCVLYVTVGMMGGTTFCLHGILNASGLAHFGFVRTYLAWMNWPIGDVLILFGVLGLVGNTLASYRNVYKARLRENRSPWTPLVGLLPFVVQSGANLAWMHGNHAMVMAHGPAFLPFLFFWGVSFAYLVGLLIVAHVCGGRFPYWNWLFIPSVLGAIDANIAHPWLQTSGPAVAQTVYVALAVSVGVYGYFVYDVITTITDETGKPCFSVVPPVKKQSSVQ